MINKLPMIYDYQRPVYQQLLRAFWAHQRSLGAQLEVTPRPHRLLIGSTGSGKTHIALAVAKELNWDYMIVNAPAWVLTGAKGTPTWDIVKDWLDNSLPGRPRVLIMDEVDKIPEDSEWGRMLLSELYTLIDGRVIDRSEAAPSLENKVKRLMVVGCGAFQSCFDARPSMGFGSGPVKPPTQDELHKHLPRELVNRFHQTVLSFPDLTPEDYSAMALQAIATLPESAQRYALSIYDAELQRGIDGKIGARFPEALVSAVFDAMTLHETPTPWRAPLITPEVVESPEYDYDYDMSWGAGVP